MVLVIEIFKRFIKVEYCYWKFLISGKSIFTEDALVYDKEAKLI